MDKRQLIDDIRRINTTAQPRFLAQFDAEALKQYLNHLCEAQTKRPQPPTAARRSAGDRVLV